MEEDLMKSGVEQTFQFLTEKSCFKLGFRARNRQWRKIHMSAREQTKVHEPGIKSGIENRETGL
jgi:hypothetical protein